MSEWVAYYMPATDGDNPSRLCKTRKDAKEYINSRLCEPECESCLAEWFIVEKDKLDKCKSIPDIFDACGYKKIEPEPPKERG